MIPFFLSQNQNNFLLFRSFLFLASSYFNFISYLAFIFYYSEKISVKFTNWKNKNILQDIFFNRKTLTRLKKMRANLFYQQDDIKRQINNQSTERVETNVLRRMVTRQSPAVLFIVCLIVFASCTLNT